MSDNKNKAFWVFQNMKESVDMLPPKLRGKAWEMIINYAFGDEKVEESCSNLKVLFTFRVIKPLIRLRGIAGSQNGKSNNPTGLTKRDKANIGANIGAIPLITETETETITETEKKKEKKQKKEYVILGEFKNVKLTLEEIKKLVNDYEWYFESAIEALSSYIESRGDKYKSHYAVLGKTNWVWEKVHKNTDNGIKPMCISIHDPTVQGGLRRQTPWEYYAQKYGLEK